MESVHRIYPEYAMPPDVVKVIGEMRKVMANVYVTIKVSQNEEAGEPEV